MGWATGYIGRLQAGETVQFRPRGHSMKGKIESGQLCTVKPIEDASLLALVTSYCAASAALNICIW